MLGEGLDINTIILLVTNAVIIGINFGINKKELSNQKDLLKRIEENQLKAYDALRQENKDRYQEIAFQLAKFSLYGERLATIESQIQTMWGRIDELRVTVEKELRNRDGL